MVSRLLRNEEFLDGRGMYDGDRHHEIIESDPAFFCLKWVAKQSGPKRSTGLIEPSSRLFAIIFASSRKLRAVSDM